MKSWRSAHDLLGDDAERFAASWEVLLSVDEPPGDQRQTRSDRLLDMVAAGLTPHEIALELHMRPASARHAVAMARRRLRHSGQ